MSHSKDKFVLFVPHWISRILDREKISYSKLLNLSELRKHLSVEDISILYWINVDSNPPSDGQISPVYYDGLLGRIWSNPEDADYVFNKIRPMEHIAKDAIRARLSETIPTQENQEPFKINTISEVNLIFVVTVYPGIYTTHKTILSVAILKLLYAHTGYDDMARNHLFKGYIEKLALANNVL